MYYQSFPDGRGRFRRGLRSIAAGAALAAGPYIGKKIYSATVGKGIDKSIKYASKAVTNNMGSHTSAKVLKQPKPKKSRKSKSKVVNLSREVKALQSKMAVQMSQYSYRLLSTGKNLTATNQLSFANVISQSVSTIETVLGSAYFFNPAAPGTLINASLAAGTYASTCRILSQYVKVTFRNNYQVPARLHVLACQPKIDTSIGVTTAWTNGLADNASGALTATDINLHPTDSRQLTQIWSTKKSEKVVLQPGDEYEFVFTTPGFKYDPAYVDSHASSYQPGYQSYSIDCIVRGIIGHDTVADQRGFLPAGVDYVIERTFKVEYDAGGTDLRYLVNTASPAAMTTLAVCSSKPLADNISYSVI